jgi:L-rhamnose isomerase/sugar isomerase
MLDQSHNVKPKIEAMIQSVVNVQVAYARALLIERDRLSEARWAGDVVTAEETLLRAFRTDVRALLAAVREEMGLASDPLAAYRASGYYERVCTEREPMAGAASGYPGA